jgi:hypothetical protein
VVPWNLLPPFGKMDDASYQISVDEVERALRFFIWLCDSPGENQLFIACSETGQSIQSLYRPICLADFRVIQSRGEYC